MSGLPTCPGLVTGRGEGDDGQIREGILKEVMLKQDEL